MTKETQITLPDFRNLGILLRVALALQVLGLLAALAHAADLAGAMALFFRYAAYLEPPLLTAMLILFLAAPKLAAQPRHQAFAACVAIGMASAAFWHVLLQADFPDAGGSGLWRTLLLAGSAAGLILVWLDWRARRLSPALAEARLQALQARIRPHFLFNSINSVLSLMRSNPAQAETALENLAELYRVLMADNRQLSPLAREMELARAYLDLEALRLGERLQVDWRVDAGVDAAPQQILMPALVLQPLLENAVCHGIEPRPEGGRIGVDIFARDGQLNVVVRNPCHADAPARPGNRMALSNIRERLALHFDAEARLSAHQVGDEFVVQMVLPLKEAARARAA
ncbi:MAG: histidine kinase [Pseudomonadota bacterium]|nr:histidine kinase [Pseudomonadota bacterium]